MTDTTKPALPEPSEPSKLLSRVLHELAGAASLCWTPKPTGVFDSQLAIGFVEQAIAEMRAAIDAAVAEARAARDDGMPARAPERHLRRLLAGRVNMPHAYYDDGEAHGMEHGISIDFMREPVADIDAKLRALGIARYECELAATPSPTPPARVALSDEQLTDLWNRSLMETRSVYHFARAVIAEYERINGIAPAQDAA